MLVKKKKNSENCNGIIGNRTLGPNMSAALYYFCEQAHIIIENFALDHNLWAALPFISQIGKQI